MGQAMITTLHNHSAGDLADELGALKAEMATLSEREKVLRDEFIRRKLPAVEGALFRATVSESLRQSLDAERVKAEMGMAWYEARCKIAIITTVRVSARTGAKRQAAA